MYGLTGSHRSGSLARVLLRACLVAAAFISVVLPGTEAEAISFSFNYGSTFTDANARTALQFAANIWGGLISERYTGETITINASWNNALAGTTALAGTIPTYSVLDSNLPDPGFAYPIALASDLLGQKLNTSPNDTNDIRIGFNPDPHSLAGETPWYFGTDGLIPDNTFDFVTNALHEIMHGLGMFSAMNGDGSLGVQVPGDGTYGMIYDKFVYDTLTSQYLMQQNPTTRAGSLINGNLVFDGANATAANGGTAPALFAPGTFELGSSVTHLTGGSGDLMVPNLGVGSFGINHNPSANDLGILRDLGWNIEQTTPAIPEPASVALVGAGLAALGLGSLFRKRR